MTATTYRHGSDYTLRMETLSMPDALGNGQHAEYSLERVWPRDETGYRQIDSIYIGNHRIARELMDLEIKNGLAIG